MSISKKINPKPDQRHELLRQLRNIKMARSMQDYVRGNTSKFYEWLDASTGKLPEGPSIWICGDCHFGNLGPVANSKGRIETQIRDLDQTVIGNPVHDLIRLGLSLATATRDSDLPGVTTLRMLEELIAGYAQEFSNESLKITRPECIKLVLRQAQIGKWKTLARENIGDARPIIPLGKKFWPISKKEKQAISTLHKNQDFATLATMLRSRSNKSRVEVIDSAFWVKGCSSLGNLRYAVLLGIDSEYCLIDIKEAVKAIAPRTAGCAMPRDNARRVMLGAQALSPYLGERMSAIRFMDSAACMRELLPQDLKLEINRMTRTQATLSARYLGAVVGKAHARQMDNDTRSQWHKELLRNRDQKIDAPAWLWSSVVELTAIHEASYLDHCRSYLTEIEG